MRVRADDVELWFEVYGQRYRPSSEGLVEQPTVVLVHGGPGLDTGGGIRESAASFSDFAQVVLFDQRGHGRSDYSTPDRWNLAQWAADLRAFCRALRIDRPIVVGQSFGGYVAQVYAGTYPDDPAGVALLSTAMRRDDAAVIARFAELGGSQAAQAVARSLREKSSDALDGFVTHCLPLLSVKPGAAEFLASFGKRNIRTDEVNIHFAQDWENIDLRPYVEGITCPVLVVSGQLDPVMPVALANELPDTLGQRLWRFDLLPECGHLIGRDQPQRLHDSIKQFVNEVAARQPSQTPSPSSAKPQPR